MWAGALLQDSLPRTDPVLLVEPHSRSAPAIWLACDGTSSRESLRFGDDANMRAQRCRCMLSLQFSVNGEWQPAQSTHKADREQVGFSLAVSLAQPGVRIGLSIASGTLPLLMHVFVLRQDSLELLGLDFEVVGGIAHLPPVRLARLFRIARSSQPCLVARFGCAVHSVAAAFARVRAGARRGTRGCGYWHCRQDA